MPKLAAALVMIAASFGSVAAEGFTPDEALPMGDQARELLSEGVREYLTGRPEQAALRFQDVLKLEPDNKLLYEFYLKVGDKRLQAMMELDQLEYSKLGPVMKIRGRTGIRLPAGTRISATVPLSLASHSITALSVCSSATTWPVLTASPFFTFQATRVPSVMVGVLAGKSCSRIMERSQVRKAPMVGMAMGDGGAEDGRDPVSGSTRPSPRR